MIDGLHHLGHMENNTKAVPGTVAAAGLGMLLSASRTRGAQTPGAPAAAGVRKHLSCVWLTCVCMLQVSLQDIPSMCDFLADVVDLRDVSGTAHGMAAASCCLLPSAYSWCLVVVLRPGQSPHLGSVQSIGWVAVWQCGAVIPQLA